MGFVNNLFMGAVAYGLGWAVRVYLLEKNNTSNEVFDLKHPRVVKYLLAFFASMMVVSALIGRFMLGHQSLDVLYVLVNSAVATFVFSFGLIKEKARYDLPN